jgi:branched-chain amino acid transport system permease protein
MSTPGSESRQPGPAKPPGPAGTTVKDVPSAITEAGPGHPGGEPGGRMARLRSPRLAGSAVFVIAVLAVLLGGSEYVLYESVLICIYAIVTVSQEWLFGRAGLVSLGPAAIMAVGAFTTATLSTKAWAVFPVPLLISLVFGAIVGLIIGIPGLRFSGLYLMLTTLALQFIVAFAGQKYQASNILHQAGIPVIPPHWGSLQLGTSRSLFVISAIILGVALLALSALYGGVPGRIWNAIRQDEVAASVLGVNVARWKLAAFVGSSALTAVGGSLYAYQSTLADYNSYSLDLGLALVVMVFIGGVGTLTGPIIGSAVIVLLPVGVSHLASSLSGFPAVSSWLALNEATIANGVYGLVLLLVLLFERDGIFGLLRSLGRLGLAGARRLPGRRRPAQGGAA